MSSSCAHDEFQFSPHAHELEPGVVVVAVQVRCGKCHQQFHWRGLDAGTINPNIPVVSADGYELRAPIGFGPGSVASLLQQVGLADRLVNPETDPEPPADE